MHSNEPATPATSLDLDLRRTKPNKLGYIVGNAIAHGNNYQLAYALGRLDEEIGTHEDRTYNEAQLQLREAICAALNIYPRLGEKPSPPDKPNVVELAKELSS
jgi:hypothetical protein